MFVGSHFVKVLSVNNLGLIKLLSVINIENQKCGLRKEKYMFEKRPRLLRKTSFLKNNQYLKNKAFYNFSSIYLQKTGKIITPEALKANKAGGRKYN